MESGKLKYWLIDHWFAKYILRPVLMAYLLLFLFVLFFSDTFLFPNSNSGHSWYKDTGEYIKLTTADGLKITAQHLPTPRATYTVLFSHGNGEDLSATPGVLRALHREEKFALFTYDYHGYGTSEGTASEKNTYQDIDAAYAYLTETLRVPPERIILYGYSLGGGPSVDLATRKPVAGLILQSTFTSAYRTHTRYPILPFDKFRNINKIGRIHCPVLVMHGRDDQSIPFSHGVALYRAANEPKRYLWVNGAGHDNLQNIAGDEVYQAVQEFAALIDETKRQPGTADIPHN